MKNKIDMSDCMHDLSWTNSYTHARENAEMTNTVHAERNDEFDLKSRVRKKEVGQ